MQATWYHKCTCDCFKIVNLPHSPKGSLLRGSPTLCLANREKAKKGKVMGARAGNGQFGLLALWRMDAPAHSHNTMTVAQW